MHYMYVCHPYSTRIYIWPLYLVIRQREIVAIRKYKICPRCLKPPTVMEQTLNMKHTDIDCLSVDGITRQLPNSVTSPPAQGSKFPLPPHCITPRNYTLSTLIPSPPHIRQSCMNTKRLWEACTYYNNTMLVILNRSQFLHIIFM